MNLLLPNTVKSNNVAIRHTKFALLFAKQSNAKPFFCSNSYSFTEYYLD